MEAASPTRRRRKDARPQELLDAALELFAEKGFAATRAEEVAARAHVAKGTLYLYFPSKEDLLKAVIETHLGSRLADVEQQVAEHDGSTADLARSIMVQWWTSVLDSPASAVFKLIISEVRNFPELAQYYNETVVERGHRLLGTMIERGIARGEFRPVPVESAVHSLVLPFVMCGLHRHSLGACDAACRIDAPRFVAEHVDLILAGLAAHPPHRERTDLTPRIPGPPRKKRSTSHPS